MWWLLFVLLVVLGVVVYAYLQHVANRPAPAGQSPGPVGKVKGPGTFKFDIVGESHYQHALGRIAGPRTEDGANHHCLAELVLEDDNEYDGQAVRVDIEGEPVGHLSRENARRWRAELERLRLSGTQIFVEAKIVGGWDRGGGDLGHFGVKLDLPIRD